MAQVGPKTNDCCPHEKHKKRKHIKEKVMKTETDINAVTSQRSQGMPTATRNQKGRKDSFLESPEGG